MKKHYAGIIAFFASATLMAQVTLQTMDGVNLTNGAVTLTGESAIFFPQDEPLKQRVQMVNNTSAPLRMLVRRHMDNVPANSTQQFCWGPVCYFPSVIVAQDTIDLAPGASNSTFYAYFFPSGNAGNYSVRYTFYDANNPADSSFVDINFAVTLDQPNLTSEVLIGQHYPNPAREFTQMELQLPTGPNAQIELYNLTGGLVKSYEVTSGKSTFKMNVSDLRPGVYFYTVRQDGKALVTRRLVINR